MPRYPAERHNEEFINVMASAGLTSQQAAEAVGVSVHTVKSWRRAVDAKGAFPCPKFRVDALKVALGLKLADLNDSQRRRVLEILRGMDGAR